MNNNIAHLRAADLKVMPWKNGGGITREVAKYPRTDDGGAFFWRVSIADVNTKGPFSRFPECRRLISVIGGEGMELEVEGRGALMLKPYTVHEFDGESDASGELPFGPVRDLNVIFQPAHVRASMRFSDGAEQWRTGPGHTVILINVQQASVVRVSSGEKNIELASLDAVLATAGAAFESPAGAGCAVIEIFS